MQHQIILKAYYEILWWIFTFLVLFAVLTPISNAVPEFTFFGVNAIFIICFITFTRYTFLLKHSWMARLEWVKLTIMGASAIILFMLITDLGDFNSYIRETGLHDLVKHLPVSEQLAMERFMRNEMIFFGVGAILSGVLLPIRMLISIWRGRNTGGI